MIKKAHNWETKKEIKSVFRDYLHFHVYCSIIHSGLKLSSLRLFIFSAMNKCFVLLNCGYASNETDLNNWFFPYLPYFFFDFCECMCMCVHLELVNLQVWCPSTLNTWVHILQKENTDMLSHITMVHLSN